MLEVLIVLCIVSVALYLFGKIPFPPPLAWAKQAIVVIVVVLALLWLLDGFGAFGAWHWRGHWR